MRDLIAELTRNIVGFFLVLMGVAVIGLGAHYHIDKEVEVGATLVSAALLAFQSKRTPDGNTTTTQITVPPPAVASPETAASPK